jgi:hypothetical protein
MKRPWWYVPRRYIVGLVIMVAYDILYICFWRPG